MSVRAYLQLARLPNVFTAIADVLLGFLITHQGFEPAAALALLVAASACLYTAGMALNDYFDREQDAAERPNRPIPSGRVSPAAAARFGYGLLIVGLACGAGAAIVARDPRPAAIAACLALSVWLYDRIWKRTPLAAPAMGLCRFLNVLLGMSVAASPWTAGHWLVAAGVGVYIAGVTWFARTEAHVSNRGLLAGGMVAMLAGLGMLAWFPQWMPKLAVYAIDSPPRWYCFWALLAFMIGRRALYAVLDPKPQLVQAAVKHAIVSLIVLDLAACYAVRGMEGAAVILPLLIPTMFLGRWIYST